MLDCINRGRCLNVPRLQLPESLATDDVGEKRASRAPFVGAMRPCLGDDTVLRSPRPRSTNVDTLRGCGGNGY